VRHGTHTAYAHHRCRCEACTEAERLYGHTSCEACGGPRRKGGRTGLCAECWKAQRKLGAEQKPERAYSELALLERADYAYRMLRAGEDDSAGLLAAVVWPSL